MAAKKHQDEHPDVKRYLRDWTKLKLKNNVLNLTVSIDGQQYDQLIVPKSITDTILHALYDYLGHQGAITLLGSSSPCFFLAENRQDIKSKADLCNRCVRQKIRPIPTAELANITSSAPMELVSIDYFSLEMLMGRYEHIHVTDHFTRYATAVPTRNQKARTTARVGRKTLRN